MDTIFQPWLPALNVGGLDAYHQVSSLEATKATLTERLQQAMTARDEALQFLRIRLASRPPENPEETDSKDTLTKELFPAG